MFCSPQALPSQLRMIAPPISNSPVSRKGVSGVTIPASRAVCHGQYFEYRAGFIRCGDCPVVKSGIIEDLADLPVLIGIQSGGCRHRDDLTCLWIQDDQRTRYCSGGLDRVVDHLFHAALNFPVDGEDDISTRRNLWDLIDQGGVQRNLNIDRRPGQDIVEFLFDSKKAIADPDLMPVRRSAGLAGIEGIKAQNIRGE